MFERRVEFTAAYDKRNADPKRNYGIHGVNALFTLIGDLGAVRFVLFTSWELDVLAQRAPLPAQIEIHAMRKRWAPNTEGEDCDLLPGGKCFASCYYQLADDAYTALVEGGSEGLWGWMEQIYAEELGKEET